MVRSPSAGHAGQADKLNLLRRAFNVMRYGGVSLAKRAEIARAFSTVGAALKARGG